MNEHDTCEPMSFKGQMAARYRERMSMGFSLANESKGDHERPYMASSTATASSEARSHARQGVHRGKEHVTTPTDPRMKTSRNINTGLPATARSKSSLDDHKVNGNKPTMKELITKFETRSFTSGQLKQNVDAEDDRHRIARDAWGSSSQRIKMELDPTAMTSSSSSDVVDSKSSTSMSKPPHAQISRATLSLNADPHKKKQQMLQCFSRPLSETSIKTLDEPLAEDCLNVTNSHRNSDCQISSTHNIPIDEISNTEVVALTSEDQHRFRTLSPAIHLPPSRSEINGSAGGTPTRINLRTAVPRKKVNPGNKYVVHKKDWGRGPPTGHKDSNGPMIAISNHDTSYRENLAIPTLDKDSGTRDRKISATIDMQKDIPGKAKHPSTSPHSHTAMHKFDSRSASRQSEKLEENKETFVDDKQRTKAMERYLQFLKSNNQPPQRNLTSDGKLGDKMNLQKSLRPPTPHRILNLRKGSSNAPKNPLHPFKENKSSIGQEGPGLRNKLDTDARIEQLSRRGQRSKLALQTEKKSAGIDPSGGDFYINAPISSSNSIDSSVYEYPINASPSSRIGQPKSETSDIKLTRPVPQNKATPKWGYLPGRANIIKNFPKNSQIRPHSARAHELAEKKQSKHISSIFRGRSASASKTPDTIETMKMGSLFGASPKSMTSVSSNPAEPLLDHSPSNRYGSIDMKTKTSKCEVSDIGSLILTEDELADNDLVPIHLREKKSRDSSGHVSVILSSSDDSYRPRSKTPIILQNVPQIKKIPTASSEKHHYTTSDTPDIDDQHYFDKMDTRQINKHFQSIDENKTSKNSAHISPERKLYSESNKLFLLHGKRRTTNTPTKIADQIIDDSTNHRHPSIMLSKVSSSQFSSNPKGNKPGEGFHNLTRKDSKELKEVPSNHVPEERRGYNNSRNGKARKMNDEFLSSEVASSSRRTDIPLASGEGHLDKNHPYMHMKPIEQPRASPTKRTIRHTQDGHIPSISKEHLKDKKGYGSAELHMMHEQMLRDTRDRDTRDRDTQIVPDNFYNFFHFGHNEGKQEEFSDPDNRTEKTSTSSPQRKRRKAERPKKQAKKKKHDDSDDDISFAIRSQLTPKVVNEKRFTKEKWKDSTKDEDAEKFDNTEKMEQPFRRKSSGDLSCKSHLKSSKRYTEMASTKSSRKEASRDNSVSSSFSDCRLSPKPIAVGTTPEVFPSVKKGTSRGRQNRTVARLAYEAANRQQFRSQIPLLIISSSTPRRKLDRLVQYRRWREAMLDCLRPSKLPLSESFRYLSLHYRPHNMKVARKTLDSAVMEEWALHCWQPSRDMYVDSHGVWWSASYQEVETGGVPESILGDGRFFSREGFLDLTARLPYMKVGPVRFLHATYILMAVACVTLGNMGVRLYHCGGDEYEYYCPDDDLECLMEMFSQGSR